MLIQNAFLSTEQKSEQRYQPFPQYPWYHIILFLPVELSWTKCLEFSFFLVPDGTYEAIILSVPAALVDANPRIDADTLVDTDKITMLIILPR